MQQAVHVLPKGAFLQKEARTKVVAKPSKAYNKSIILRGGSLEQEAGLIAQIAEGNLSAYENLCRTYQKRLFAYLFRMLNDRDTVEEVMNDVLHGIWRGAIGFKGNSRPSTWIFGIARNKALSRLERREMMSEDIEKAEKLSGGDDGAETNLIRKDLVTRALNYLSPEHREVIELTFFSGMSYQEIADIANCPVNTVKTRMFHAKQHLRGILKKSVRPI